MFWKKVKNRKKWMAAFLCATALTVTACGGGTTETSNTGTTETQDSGEETSNAESESIMCRVTAVGDNTLTVMSMGNGNMGERPNGEKPDGTPSADGEMPNGEKPDGTPPADMQKGEKPDGTPSADGEMPKGEMPDGTPPADAGENGDKSGKDKMRGEEKTIIISDSTTIKKENEDGTTEDASLSDISEGSMIKVTGTDSDDGYQASEIVISSMQGFGGKDRNGGAEQRQEESNEADNNSESAS